MKNEFLKYNITELAAEETFISWVKEGINGSEWAAWMADHPEMDSVVEGARTIVNNIQFRAFPLDNTTKTALWKKIDDATISGSSGSMSRRIFMISGVAVAAAVLLLMYSVFSKPSGAIDIITEIGGQEVVSLPDNSTIKLNAVSRVQYDKAKFKSERSLKLEGEAFFNVQKGSTFTVVTDQGSVEVLGTSFNVYSRDDSLAVSCYTGRVRVTKGSEEAILTAGESVAFTNIATQLNKDKFEIKEDNPSWTKGMFTFENQKLETVFKELSRQYNIEIIYDDPSIPEEMVGSAFFEAGSLEKALDEITYPYSLSYIIEGKTIVIKK